MTTLLMRRSMILSAHGILGWVRDVQGSKVVTSVEPEHVEPGGKGLPGEGSSDGKDGDRALSLIGVSAADVVARAVIHAILAAETVGSYTCYRDRFPEAMYA